MHTLHMFEGGLNGTVFPGKKIGNGALIRVKKICISSKIDDEQEVMAMPVHCDCAMPIHIFMEGMQKMIEDVFKMMSELTEIMYRTGNFHGRVGLTNLDRAHFMALKTGAILFTPHHDDAIIVVKKNEIVKNIEYGSGGVRIHPIDVTRIPIGYKPKTGRGK